MQNGLPPDADAPNNVASNPDSTVNGDGFSVSGHDSRNDDELSLQHPSTPSQSHPLRDASSATRGRKRKLSEVLTPQRAKKPSPPWKQFAADGVSSFTEGGRRKSSRTNAIPLDLRPSSAKRTTRGEYGRHKTYKAQALGDQSEDYTPRGHANGKAITKRKAGKGHSPASKAVESKRRLSYENATSTRPGPKAAQPGRPRGSKTRQPVLEQVDRPVPARRGRPPKHLANGNAAGPTHTGPTAPNAHKSRFWFHVGPRPIPLVNPAGVSLPKKYGSLAELLANDDPLEGDEVPRLTSTQIAEEARSRQQMINAARPGGALSTSVMSESAEVEDGVSHGPIVGYSLPDYLNKHIIDLQARVVREGRDHRALAKRIAGYAAAAARSRMPKSLEEIETEQRNGRIDVFRRTCVKEIKFIFDSTTARIWHFKRAEYEEREAAAGRDRMKRMVDRSEGLLSARSGRRLTQQDDESASLLDSELDHEGSIISDDEVDTASDKTSEDDSDDDSESEDDNAEGDDPDAGLTREQLLQKYKDMPDLPSDEESDQTDAISKAEWDDEQEVGVDQTEPLNGIDPSQHTLEEVDDVLLDNSASDSNEDSGSDSDDSTEMSDESTDDSGSGNESGSGQDDSEDEAEEGPDLLMGFLSKAERKQLHQPLTVSNDEAEAPLQQNDIVDPAPVPHTDASGAVDGMDLSGPPPGYADEHSGTEPSAAPALASEEPSRQSTPNTSRASRPESMSSIEPTSEKLSLLHNHAELEDAERMTVSPLIRGTLRPYQHAGFDWLARMYHESTNGILADEMGLGKTFQTIALLAHLATHHQVWGPHLVVVPTSVMLNWEIEFKKFCPGFKILTYYGTQEERKQKRKGWMNKDKWNVCITSYQLALQDAQPLKRRGWHYLILDEAHNIKNFRSQRWQTLLSFKSEARLLLTGTPLQNNLSELWSLLFFLAPEHDEDGNTGFGSLQEFSKVFHRPVDLILEHGRGVLDEESVGIVNKLHKVLRPHLLRRLKADVEKQMPKKYEHVTVCRLSKRQRQLYDSYMSRAGTKESFASGNYMSIINCLMQLRKVCNHPDLFDTRQIVTSFAMPKSAVADFEIKELLVRKKLLNEKDAAARHTINLWAPNEYASASMGSQRLSAAHRFDAMIKELADDADVESEGNHSITSSLSLIGARLRSQRIASFQAHRDLTDDRCRRRPLFGLGLFDLLTKEPSKHQALRATSRVKLEHGPMTAEPFLESMLQQMKPSLAERAESVQPLVQRFGCVTPVVTAPGVSRLALTDSGANLIQDFNDPSVSDPYHESRVRLSIAFPDKSLIQYDCGKLQQLDKLLRKLQSGGHRALIFTQMTKVLDILEQFMNLHGHRYLRLDGSTKIEQRQVLTDRFNNDPRILCFILSSRSGGLGINLTGADTVIFYDLDWNPAMDKQCQDRCHRIGQTRDVHIYRFVSEGTIEANILRKSNQKRMLDDVVIQEGDFTTEHLNKLEYDDSDVDANAALDRVLGGGVSNGRALHQAEDKEDQEAAKAAQKEDVQTDAADFDERPTAINMNSSSTAQVPKISTPIPAIPQTPVGDSSEADTPKSLVMPRPTKSAADLTEEGRQKLFEEAVAEGLPQDKPDLQWKHDDDGQLIIDEQGNPAELPGYDEYILRLFQWEMRDLIYAPPKDNKKGKKGKKGGDWGRIRR